MSEYDIEERAKQLALRLGVKEVETIKLWLSLAYEKGVTAGIKRMGKENAKPL